MTQENFSLKAQIRDLRGKKVKQLRKQGLVPANLFGNEVKNINLSLDAIEFNKLFSNAGTSAIIALHIEGEDKPRKILLHEPQFDPIKNAILHADLFQVNMKEKIRTEIPLNFIGDAPAVIDLEGNLITNKDVVDVECLPDDLISEITVDLAVLKTFEDSVHVKDLVVPSGIEILSDLDEVVVSVSEPRSEEEMSALDESTTEAEQAAVAELDKSDDEGNEGTDSENESDAKKE